MFLCYGRVSTLEQAHQLAASLPEQERNNRLFAKLRGADEFDIQVYSDADVSGGTPLRERPEGGRMLTDAQAGDTLVATKLDRMFRNALDALQTIEDLKKREIDVILGDISHEPVGKTATSAMFFTMLAAFAQFEHRRIAERISEGRTFKRNRSGYLGGIVPYGFTVVGTDRKSTLEPVPGEQENLAVIKQVWGRFTPAAAIRELESRGIRNRKGKSFGITEVKRLVSRAAVTSAQRATHEP